MASCLSAEIPCITLVVYTHVEFFVKKRSKVCWWKVGSVTTWVRPLSALSSMNLLVSSHLSRCGCWFCCNVFIQNSLTLQHCLCLFHLDSSMLLHILILVPQYQNIPTPFHILSLLILCEVQWCHLWLFKDTPFPAVFIPWKILSVSSYCRHHITIWENFAVIDFFCYPRFCTNCYVRFSWVC